MTVTLPLTAIESVVSDAVYVTDSAVVSVTENVASPPELVVVDTPATCDEPPEAWSATFRPDRGNPLASYRRTVIVAAVWPSAGTLELLTTTVLSLGSGRIGGGVPKVNSTAWVTSRFPSLWSSPVRSTYSGVVSLILKVAAPVASVTAVTAWMVA